MDATAAHDNRAGFHSGGVDAVACVGVVEFGVEWRRKGAKGGVGGVLSIDEVGGGRGSGFKVGFSGAV